MFVDQIFRIFDKDGNGSIDFKVILALDLVTLTNNHLFVWLMTFVLFVLFCDINHLQEFMMATDMTASGSPEEKLRWAFKMYDKDGSGALTLKLRCKI